MKKRILSAVLAACMLLAFASCEKSSQEETLPEETSIESSGGWPRSDFCGGYPFTMKELVTLYDVTDDGIVDMCYCMMCGSGMVRTEIIVYDRNNDTRYVLDGFNYDYFIRGVEDERLIVIESGPNGYGDPIIETPGTVEIQDGSLVFVADEE